MSLIVPNRIEGLARAMLGEVQPLTGNRSSGQVTVTAVGADTALPRNAYLVPVVKGALQHQWAFKVGPNAATLAKDGTGGSWTVTNAGTAVNIVSNLGGVRHNLAAGTTFRFDPPVEGIQPTAVAAAAITGADEGVVKDAVFFEELESAEAQRDIFDALIGRFPAIMVVWMRSTPVDGKTVGVDRGRTRKGRGVIVMHETFVLYVITGRSDPDPRRRREGIDILEDVSALLTDKSSNQDFEGLSVLGGVEINERARVPLPNRPAQYIYAITVRLSRTLRRTDVRTFNPWLRTRYQDQLRAEAPLVAGQIVDESFSMPVE